jgi:Flp pilus assembly protein TadG
MDRDMLTKIARLPVFTNVVRKFKDYKSDESGAIAIFIVIMFVLILMFAGIAVDTVRFEMRRVALQETLDRATLAAANISLPPSTTPQSVVTEWFQKAGLGDELTVDYFPPTVGGTATTSNREATAKATVRSYNHFMQMLDIPYLEGPAVSVASQGINKVEVMMVLDITGSMGEASGSTTKIAALRDAASNFLTVLKFNKDTAGNYTIDKDPDDLVSIGMVPYSSNVNIPVALRNQFTVSNLSWWNGVANQGVQSPNTNCFEIPESTFSSLELSRTTAIPMAAVADTRRPTASNGALQIPSPTTTTDNFGGTVVLSYRSVLTSASGNTGSVPFKNSNDVYCNHGDNFSTGADESGSNLVALPSTDIAALKTQISQLNPRGTTSIAVGMRWGTALIDQSASAIYTNLISETAMAGRPSLNDDAATRKVIVLMTDGTHVASKYILDAYKSGPSPIWRGTDGNLAIRFTAGGQALTGGTRPFIGTGKTCSYWTLATNREFFVPHLKAASVRRQVGTQAEGSGTGTLVSGGCDPLSWVAATGTPATPKWTGSGTVRQLDWSEVWRYVRVDWVIQQLYMRSGVSGTSSYTTLFNTFVGNFLSGEANMDSLLNTNCTAAKTAGVEIFGIVLGDDVTIGPIQNCSSPGTGYFYQVLTADSLNAAFEDIAARISDLKLTQ